jgi:hypothetical protein
MKLRLLHRGDEIRVFLEHKKRLLGSSNPRLLEPVSPPPFVEEGGLLSARKPFCGALFAEGGGHFILFYTRLRVAALIKILLFGAIIHHARMCDLGLLLGVTRGHDFIRHIKYSVRQALFRNCGDTPFIRKT